MLKEKPKNRQEIIDTIAGYFEDKPVLKAYLFGSFGRNEEDFDDIDIMVELDHSEFIGIEFINMKIELEEMLGANVDLLSEEADISLTIRNYIDADKQLIYEKGRR